MQQENADQFLRRKVDNAGMLFAIAETARRNSLQICEFERWTLFNKDFSEFWSFGQRAS